MRNTLTLLFIAPLTLSLAGCPAKPGIQHAAELLFGAVSDSLQEAVLRLPADVRATSDIQCDTGEICDSDGNTLASECSLGSAAFVPEVGEPLVACEMRCDLTDCVAEASEEAHLDAPLAMFERCLMATSACEVETDACSALAATTERIQEAIDDCHREPCDSLRECLSRALLGDLLPEDALLSED